MPAETTEQTRQRVIASLRARLREQLRDDLEKMAAQNVFPSAWLPAREVTRQLNEAGYWASHPEPLAPFLPAHECIAAVNEALDGITQSSGRTWWRHLDQYRANSVDWAASAAETALRLRLARRNEERTAIFCGIDDASVIFANEDFSRDPIVRRQVAALRDGLRAAGIHELSFATSPDGAAWVMLVWTASEQLLQKVLLSLWTTTSTASV